MIGKNKRVIASILSLAVMASALPISGVLAVEDTDTAVSVAADNSVSSWKDLTLSQLLYIAPDETVSNWNERFAKHVKDLEANGFNESVDKSEYQDVIDYVVSNAGQYSDIVKNIIDNADAAVSLENGVFTINADVKNVSSIVDEKLNEKIEAAVGDYADEFNIQVATSLDMNFEVTVDTNTLADDKTVTVSYKAVDAEGKEYTLWGMFDFASAKLSSIADEFEKFCNDKVAENQKKLDDAVAAGASAETIADAQKDLDNAKKQLSDVNDTFDGYQTRIDNYKAKADNYLGKSVSVSSDNAADAYAKLYDKVPSRIQAKLPSTLDAAISSEGFSKALGAVSNGVTVADVKELLDGATDVTIELKNGVIEATAKVYDEELDIAANKLITVRVNAASADQTSTATAYLDIRRELVPDESTTTSVSETVTTDDSGNPVTSVSDTVVTDDSGNPVTSVSDGSDVSDSGSVTTSVSDGSDVSDSGSVTTSVSEAVATDDSGNPVTSVSDGSDVSDSGSVTTSVSDGSDVSESTSTSENEDTVRRAILADVNHDYDNDNTISPEDAISSYDALLMLQNVVGTKDFTDFENVIGDVDYDGTITSYDALLTLQYVVQLKSDFEGALRVRVTFDENNTIISKRYFDAVENEVIIKK